MVGVFIGDMGVGENGEFKEGYMSGMELCVKYIVFVEGCCGYFGKDFIEYFVLDKDSLF